MSARVLHRISLVCILLAGLLILYVTLAPEPPHWGTVLPPVQVDVPGALPPSKAPPPGWTAHEEEAAGHALLFFVLGVVAALWYATGPAARRAPQRTLVATMLALWLFGGISEALQAFTPTRTPQLSDLAFDVFGAFLGFLGGGLAWRLLFTRILKRPDSPR